MERKHNKNLVENARQLRKNMTSEERKLWYEFLRNYSVRFTRQKVLGKYILDFYCAKANLAIEINGSQHFEDKNVKYDNKRTEYLKIFGIQVIRFSNYEINNNFYSVCSYIDNIVKSLIK